jgi:hypothetical protein
MKKYPHLFAEKSAAPRKISLQARKNLPGGGKNLGLLGKELPEKMSP